MFFSRLSLHHCSCCLCSRHWVSCFKQRVANCQQNNQSSVSFITLSERLGGPFYEYGEAFYLTSREYREEPEKSEHMFFGCPIQVTDFEKELSEENVFEGSDIARGEGNYFFIPAKLAGDVGVINLMLAGGDFRVRHRANSTIETAQKTSLTA